jgi:hypothetical protein
MAHRLGDVETGVNKPGGWARGSDGFDFAIEIGEGSADQCELLRSAVVFADVAVAVRELDVGSDIVTTD